MMNASGGDRATGRGTVVHNEGDAALPELCRRECPHGLEYTFLGVHIQIYSNETLVLERVRPFLAGFEEETTAADGDAIRFYLRCDESLERPFSMVTPTGRFAESTSWEPVFGYLMNQLHTWMWAGLPDVLPLHSGAVAWQGQGLLISAASGGGKTTLALELATAGWDYLSDEFAPICLTTFRVLPFARRPHVSGEAVRALLGRRAERVLAGEAFLDDDGTERYLVPIADVGSVGSASEVSWLIFPEMSDAGPCLTPLSKPEALTMLAASALSHQYAEEWRFRAIDALITIVRLARCCKLALGPIGSNGGLITALVLGEDVGIGAGDVVDADELAAFQQVASRTRALVQQRASRGGGNAQAGGIERKERVQDDG